MRWDSEALNRAIRKIRLQKPASLLHQVGWNPPQQLSEIRHLDALDDRMRLSCGCMLDCERVMWKPEELTWHICLPAYKVRVIEDRDAGDEDDPVQCYGREYKDYVAERLA